MAITSTYANDIVTKSELKVRGNLYSTGGQVGYGTGAGATVTQASSRTTGVPCDGQCGQITLVSAAGSTSVQSFTVTCAAVLATTDVIVLCQVSGTDKMDMTVTAVAVGSFQISFRTMSGTTTEQPVISYMIFKGVAA